MLLYSLKNIKKYFYTAVKGLRNILEYVPVSVKGLRNIPECYHVISGVLWVHNLNIAHKQILIQIKTFLRVIIKL